MKTSPFWQGVKNRGWQFAKIGFFLALLKTFLFFLARTFHMELTWAYPVVTVITYTINYIWNDRKTWGDRRTDAQGNVMRVLVYIPIKATLWFTDQRIFAFWLEELPEIIQYANSLFQTNLAIPSFYLEQVSSLLVIGCMLPVNYLVFDQIITMIRRRLTPAI